jgi:hypothetical protein
MARGVNEILQIFVDHHRPLPVQLVPIQQSQVREELPIPFLQMVTSDRVSQKP